MGLEIMFVDHPIRKQAFLDKKISILHRGHTGIVSNWLTHDLFKNWKKFYLSGILDKWALKLCLMIIQVENKPS